MLQEVKTEIQFVTSRSQASVDLRPIHQAILQERTLLHPSLENLERSYVQGMSVVMMDEGRPVGHVRFTPLLDEELKQALGLSSDFPSVWEIGSAVIFDDPAYRGRGHYADLRNNLVAGFVDRIYTDGLLLLGTTKSVSVIKSLPRADRIGVFFKNCFHHEFPMVSALTCVCEGDFGQGFHVADNCKKRLQPEGMEIEERVGEVINTNNEHNKCVMYVSSVRLAEQIDCELNDRFGSLPGLVDRLKAVGHFD